ncbi:MAG TPA: hypothetical protein VNA32_08805, partial [Actinomycetota bacterium]|nr:hypothetical protein [Actinomycetota bacterium]
MDNREKTKIVVRLLTEAGAGYIAKELIKNNVSTPTRLDKRIMVVLGAAALAGLIAERAGRYMSKTVDELFDAYDKLKKEL